MAGKVTCIPATKKGDHSETKIVQMSPHFETPPEMKKPEKPSK